MKNTKALVGLLFLVLFIASSCGSPYRKRKRCRGNGSWYGNRNLGAADQKAKIQTTPNETVYQLTASAEH